MNNLRKQYVHDFIKKEAKMEKEAGPFNAAKNIFSKGKRLFDIGKTQAGGLKNKDLMRAMVSGGTGAVTGAIGGGMADKTFTGGSGATGAIAGAGLGLVAGGAGARILKGLNKVKKIVPTTNTAKIVNKANPGPGLFSRVGNAAENAYDGVNQKIWETYNSAGKATKGTRDFISKNKKNIAIGGGATLAAGAGLYGANAAANSVLPDSVNNGYTKGGLGLGALAATGAGAFLYNKTKKITQGMNAVNTGFLQSVGGTGTLAKMNPKEFAAAKGKFLQKYYQSGKVKGINTIEPNAINNQALQKYFGHLDGSDLTMGGTNNPLSRMLFNKNMAPTLATGQFRQSFSPFPNGMTALDKLKATKAPAVGFGPQFAGTLLANNYLTS